MVAILVSVYALMGIAIGVWIKVRNDKELRALAASAATTVVLTGVTEPTLYGLVLRFKRLIPIYMVAGGIGGAINGTLVVKMTALVFHNVFSIPAETPPLYFICGASTVLITSLILVQIFGLESRNKEPQPNRRI